VTLPLFLVAIVALVRWNVNATWMILLGAAVGWAASPIVLR
jgi:hypothetical protein